MLFRVHEDYTILVKQARIALDQDLQIAPVSERQPSRPVGQSIRVHAAGHVQRCPHPRSGLAIPSPRRLRRVNAGRLPIAHLGFVSAAVITARGKRQFRFGQSGQSGYNVVATGNFGWIRFWANQYKIIVHDIEPFDTPTVCYKLLFSGLGVNQKNIAIAVDCVPDRLTGPDGHNPYIDTGFGLEPRQDIVQQTRILRRGR